MSSRTPEQRALALTDALYTAAVEPGEWSAFLEAFSADLGGGAVALSLMFPVGDEPPEYYRVHLSAKYVPAFERHFRRGLPWGPMTDPLFRAGFARANALFPDSKVGDTEYFADYMQPQGLAPEGPVAHLIAASDGRATSGISIHRRVDGRALTDEDLAMCNLLAPHLARVSAIRDQRARSLREQSARHGVLDRIPIGILVIDLQRRAVVTNRAAQQILDAGDGLIERSGILHASVPEDERALQELIEAAVHPDPKGPSRSGFVGISRPSGAHAYALVVTPVFAAATPSAVGDQVAAIFISDPAAGQVTHSATFEQLYDLSPAEAEVMSLIAAGRSLEDISEQRGVQLTTTRSQLKHVFRKTKTKRQGEIVRLALTSLGAIAPSGSGDEGSDPPEPDSFE